MTTKYGAARACAKGKARSGKKRIGTRGASFKDAKRPKSSGMSRMVKRYVEPVEVPEVPTMDTGASALSVERENVIRREIPINEVPWDYEEREEWVKVSPAYENYRLETVVVKDKPRRGYSAGALVGRETDKRTLSRRYEPGRSDKQSIGKIKPVTDQTPVFDKPKD